MAHRTASCSGTLAEHSGNFVASMRNFYLRLDYRSLAAYRIAVALVLIGDWLARWPDLEAFYTAVGVAPITSSVLQLDHRFRVTILNHITSLSGVRLAFLVGMLCYGSLLVGYRTKLAQCLSYLFFLSVVSRNRLLTSGADAALASMLMWSLFLPLGHRFSLDYLRHLRKCSQNPSLNSDDETDQTLSPPSLAALAIIFQIALIYGLGAIDKSGTTWRSGTALYYALHGDGFTTPFGHIIDHLPTTLLCGLTWGTATLEFAAPFLILIPEGQPLLRRTAIAGLGALHVGIWSTMQLGTFPFVMISNLFLLLSPSDWAAFAIMARRWGIWHTRFSKPIKSGRFMTATTFPYASHCSQTQYSFKTRDDSGRGVRKTRIQSLSLLRVRSVNCGQLSKGTKRKQWWPRSLVDFVGVGVRNAVVTILMLSVALSAYNENISKRFDARIKEPQLVRAIIDLAGIVQGWELFAPDPPRRSGWVVVDCQTSDGLRIDPLTGRSPTYNVPMVNPQYGRYWRKYLMRLHQAKYKHYLPYFVHYMAMNYNREHGVGRRIRAVDVYYVWYHIPPPGTAHTVATHYDRLIHYGVGE